MFDDDKSNQIKNELEISRKNTQDLLGQYNQIQLNKEKKMQEFRDMVLKLNKEKRYENKAKEIEPTVILYC